MRTLKRLLTWWAGSTLATVAAALWAAGRARPEPRADASPDPPGGIPPARLVPIHGHGELFFRDAPGPDADAPTVLLLHGWMFPADMHWFTSYGRCRDGHGCWHRTTAATVVARVRRGRSALLTSPTTRPR